MKSEIQVTPDNWMNIPKENQARIITLLGQLVRRQIEIQAREGPEAYESTSSKSYIDTVLQEWENSKSSPRSTGDCIRQAINHATGRTAPGIDPPPVRLGFPSDIFGLVIHEGESN